MELDQKTIDAMANAFIELVGQVECPGGAQSVTLRAREVRGFLTNREAYAADYYGVSIESYQGWVESVGTL